jgi:membrane dipeptidase
LRRGYSDDDIRKITGGNILRVMRSVEQISARLSNERPASEAQIKETDRK